MTEFFYLQNIILHCILSLCQ